VARPVTSALALQLALGVWPWVVFPLVAFWRARGSRSLAEEPAEVVGDAPLVTVIIPARDERRNIAACVRSVLSSTYPALEVVVVDDHSTDGTGALAREAGAGDRRLCVLEPPPLPGGWFGKQWACATGAAAARGAVLCFADADTRQAPDLVARSLNAMRARQADLLSVVGRQELGTFWERVVQPQVFAVMAGRYGSTERIGRSRHAHDKIANGQCLFVRRDAYDAAGGHGAVRSSVSDDLVLAKRVFQSGRQVAIVLGPDQLSTRMYTSLGELTRGWRKNMFAGGRETMPNALGRAVFPLLLLLPPLFSLWPLVLLAGYALGWAEPATAAWAAVAALLTLASWSVVYRRAGLPAWYAFAYPAGAAVLLGIVLQAIARGRRVEWKGREYVSA
jgi:chlorobactene glucosyltransferase